MKENGKGKLETIHVVILKGYSDISKVSVEELHENKVLAERYAALMAAEIRTRMQE